MDLNKKILKLGLISIGILMTISFGLFLYLKLDNPVFLKSYIEERVSQNLEYYEPIELQIRYITNSYDDIKIDYIELIEDNGKFNKLKGRRLYDRVESYGLYNVNVVGIDLTSNLVKEDFDILEFSKAKVSFNNGDNMDVDLGKVILYKYIWNDDYFEGRTSGGSSDGTSYSENVLKQDISLIKLESPLFEDTKGLYDIKIDGKDYREIFGLNYEKGEILRVDSIFETPKDILNRYTHYELQPRLYFKDSMDKKSYINVYNTRHIPYYFKFWDIYNYLRARGEI